MAAMASVHRHDVSGGCSARGRQRPGVRDDRAGAGRHRLAPRRGGGAARHAPGPMAAHRRHRGQAGGDLSGGACPCPCPNPPVSSARGAGQAAAPGSSTNRAAWRWRLTARSTWRTPATTASRSSTRPGPIGANRAARAVATGSWTLRPGWRWRRTARFTWRTPPTTASRSSTRPGPTGANGAAWAVATGSS